MRNHILNYCPHSFLHIDTHVLRSYTDNELFQTVIFNLFCTDNTNDSSLLGLFSLLLTVMLSVLLWFHSLSYLFIRIINLFILVYSYRE